MKFDKVMQAASKVPWKRVGTVAKAIGVIAIGTASTIGAFETCGKTQSVIEKGVSLLSKKDEGSN